MYDEDRRKDKLRYVLIIQDLMRHKFLELFPYTGAFDAQTLYQILTKFFF